MIVGALLFSRFARLLTPRITLIGAATLVGIDYLLFLPFHATYAQTITNMCIAGLGSGALVAALPAAAASARRAMRRSRSRCGLQSMRRRSLTRDRVPHRVSDRPEWLFPHPRLSFQKACSIHPSPVTGSPSMVPLISAMPSYTGAPATANSWSGNRLVTMISASNEGISTRYCCA